MMIPFTGLGLFQGFRGDRWLRNRIKIFEQFVIPSLQAQTNKNFTVWIAWRSEEKTNKIVQELKHRMDNISDLQFIFTYGGCPFYDDKYPLGEARARLVGNLHNTLGELLDDIGEVDEVYMTIQPSDDCYNRSAVARIQEALKDEIQAVGFKHGYIINYFNLEVSEYNPSTNPPFVTVKFPRDIFVDPILHADYTALKHDVTGYPKGTPCPSHEYYKDVFGDGYKQINLRGFLVGCHSENISTFYNHPFKGKAFNLAMDMFGLKGVDKLVLKNSIRKKILRKLPFKVQKKLRYWYAERLYNWLRK